MSDETKKPKLYTVTRDDGEVVSVTVPGGGQEPGPEDEEEFEEFLAEAIEAYAESSDVPRPRIRTFRRAQLLTSNHGLLVRIGDAEFQLTIVQSR
jgi:hypothetical protein